MMEFLGQEQEFIVNGKTFKLAKLTMPRWRNLVKWARDYLPDPIKIVLPHINSLPKELAHELLFKAYEDARGIKSTASPDVQSILFSTPEGLSTVLHELLSKHHPELTADDAWDLMEQALKEAGPEKLLELIEKANGTVPADQKKTAAT